MYTTTTLKISDEWLVATRMSAEDVALELAVHLYQIKKVSLGKASELAGVTRLAFQQLLASRNIPLNYDVKEFEADITTLKKMKRIK